MAGRTLLNYAPALGQILVSRGIITEQQLENAVHEQRRGRTRLGQVLVSSGACTAEAIATALASQLALPVARLGPEEVDHEALQRLGEDFLRRHACIPLLSDDGCRVAVSDPSDVEVTGKIQERLGVAVTIEVAPADAILALLDRVGDQGDQLESMLQQARAAEDGEGPAVTEAQLLSAEHVVRTLLSQAVRRGASDIHVEPEAGLLRVRYRIDGCLQPGPMIPSDMSHAVVARIKVLADLDIAERRLAQDGRAHFEVDGRGHDLRVSILPTVTGETAVLRVLDPTRAIVSEEQSGLRPDVQEFLRAVVLRPHGLFLVTGPTGSGKSTTLYGMISRVNALERKVVTVEDPVEYQMPLVRQVQVHPEIGLTFASGLRAILRQDPDVILLGEIRDQETAQTAMRASMTGHLVLSTLHTNTAIGTLTRLADMGIDPFLTVSTLCGVLGQRLVRRLCVDCRESYEPDEAELARFSGSPRPEITRLWRARGCPQCGETGFRGRIAIHEALRFDSTLRRMALDRAHEEDLAEAARATGFKTFRQDGELKVLQGETVLDEIVRVVVDD